MTRSRKHRTIRGVYPLPTLFTAANLAMGCIGVGLLFDRGDAACLSCAILILVAAISDSLDGRIARATGTCSAFGEQFDSMADIVSFGMAPAWLAFVFCLKTLWPVGLAAAVWYITCAAFRLARFNANVENKSGAFNGLPSPVAAGTVASFVIMMETLHRLDAWASVAVAGDVALQQALAPWVAGAMGILGWLMISSAPYMSLKGFNMSRPQPVRLVVAALVFVYAIWSLPQLLFPIALLYIFTGLIANVVVRVRWIELVAPGMVQRAERLLAGPRHIAPHPKPNH
jgi:CDP-diacylglycerol--serine O-phosphatidyltransferase